MQFRLGTISGLVALATCLLGAAAPAQAQIGSERYSAIVVDNRTGNVLVAANPDEARHPASLTKMMTLYMVFEALREGRLTLTSSVPFSEEASAEPASKLGVPPGQSITVEQAILALVTRSANDVATALGERLGGSAERFAQMMTLRARALGMTRTTFRNAHGLPDPDQITTARDMATLGRRLLADFPDRYHYFGMTHANLGRIRLRNHNRMLEAYEGVDGIKTGYIRDSGFNIVTSASRSGLRVVGAVFGGSSWVERDQHMGALLDQGFAQLGIQPRNPEMMAAARPPMVMRQAQAAPLPRPVVRPVSYPRPAIAPALRAERGPPPAPPRRQAASRNPRAAVMDPPTVRTVRTASSSRNAVATRSAAVPTRTPVPPVPPAPPRRGRAGR